MSDDMGGLSASFPNGSSLTLVWLDSGEAVTLRYQGIINDGVLLTTPDKAKKPFQRKVYLPFEQIVEPFPGVRMKFYEKLHSRIKIDAPPNIRILRN